MTKEIAIQIIQDNATAENNSLINYTHNKGLFNETSFWTFYNAIRKLGFEFEKTTHLNRGITFNLIKGYQFFLLQVGFHFDRNDKYQIENLPENYTLYSERLRIAVDAYLTGKPINDETEGYLNEELNNVTIA